MIQPIIDSSGVIHIFKGKQSEPIKLVIGEILTAEIMDIFPTGTIQIKINNRIINAQPQRELPLSKGDTVMVKVEKPLEDGTIPLRVLSTSEREEIQRAFIQSEREISEKIFKIIENFFSKGSLQAKETKQAQIELIKSILNISDEGAKEILLTQTDRIKDFTIDILKTILSLPTENISETQKTSFLNKIIDSVLIFGRTTENIEELIKLLEKHNFQGEQISKLRNLIITNPEEITSDRIKDVLLNSGVALEAKIKKAITETIKIEQIREDLKVILNQISKEATTQGMEEVNLKVEQILRQIEGYQVLSKTFQGFFTFLPLMWQELEGGNIAYKSLKRQGKEYHTVFVTLNFKDEPLSFLVTMINKTFFVSFSSSSEILNAIKELESELRDRFNQYGMILSNVNYVVKREELIRQWNIKEGNINLKI